MKVFILGDSLGEVAIVLRGHVASAASAQPDDLKEVLSGTVFP